MRTERKINAVLYQLPCLLRFPAKAVPNPGLSRIQFLPHRQQLIHRLHTMNNQWQPIFLRQFHLLLKHPYLKLHRSSCQFIETRLSYRHKLLFHKQLLQKFKLLFRIAFRQFPGMNAGRIEISLFTCRPDIRSRQAQRIIHR